MSLILASTSPYRKELLDKLSVPYVAVKPDFDEEPFKNKGLSPNDLALTLANGKALSLSKKYASSVIIGSDQVIHLNGKFLNKPGSFEKAFAQLKEMKGKTHELITAVCVWSAKEEISWANKTLLTMRNLSDAEIEKYLREDEPYDCAGSYKLESRGVRLFSEIQTSDYTSIIGLPLIELTTILKKIQI